MLTPDREAALTPPQPEHSARAAGWKALQWPRRQLRGPARSRLWGASGLSTGKVERGTPLPQGSNARSGAKAEQRGARKDGWRQRRDPQGAGLGTSTSSGRRRRPAPPLPRSLTSLRRRCEPGVIHTLQARTLRQPLPPPP